MNNKLKYTISFLLVVGISFYAIAQKKKSEKAKSTSEISSTEIHWMTVEEVQEKMITEPRKVYMDVYTDWCGWCKVMDKKTFTNQYVIDYLNKNFYCIHFNAERAEEVLFNGKKYGRSEGSKTNELAIQWMGQRMSYPTSLFFDEGFTNPQPVPGYLEVPNMELIATYFVGNFHKTKPFEQYQKEFKGTWK
jgi:thioredoxin-related protein